MDYFVVALEIYEYAAVTSGWQLAS